MKRLVAILSTIFISAVALLGVGVPAQADSGVVISDAWVRSSNFSSHAGGMTGIFAKITNNTKRTVVLTGGNCFIAAMVQTHTVSNGMMMEQKGGIAIKPGKSVILQPGGLHVMLMGLKAPILAGDKFVFQWKFKGAKAQRTVLTARPSAAGDETYQPSK